MPAPNPIGILPFRRRPLAIFEFSTRNNVKCNECVRNVKWQAPLYARTSERHSSVPGLSGDFGNQHRCGSGDRYSCRWRYGLIA